MREHRGHLGGALLTIAGGALIAAGLGSTVLVVLGALCIVGALWAFGVWGVLWTALRRPIWRLLDAGKEQSLTPAAPPVPAWAPAPPPRPSGGILAADLIKGHRDPERAARAVGDGDKLLKAITAVKLRSLSMPNVIGEDLAAELTAQVESWRGEVGGGYVLPKLDKGWRTTLAQLKLYVEKELATMRARQGEQ
jgi:hypothetical protein